MRVAWRQAQRYLIGMWLSEREFSPAYVFQVLAIRRQSVGDTPAGSREGWRRFSPLSLHLHPACGRKEMFPSSSKRGDKSQISMFANVGTRPESVISTEHEGAERLRASGKIPRMRPLPSRYEVFSPNCFLPMRDGKSFSIVAQKSSGSSATLKSCPAGPAQFILASPAFCTLLGGQLPG
jgi:hypothetical protein